MMTHDSFQEYKKIKNISNKNFCLTFSCLFFLVNTYFFIFQPHFIFWPLFLSVVLFVLAFTRPQLIAPFNQIWIKFGQILGKMITPIIMAVLYFLVLLPVGIIFKILGRDILKIKQSDIRKTYWFDIEQPSNQNNFTEQF
jgi:hypothetical protein